MSEDRLARIEAKLDKLSDAVVAIARTEEQITSLFAHTREVNARIESHEKDIQVIRERSHLIMNTSVELGAKVSMCMDTKEVVDDMRVEVHDNTMALKRIEKVTWIAVTGVISIAGYLLERLFSGVFP